VVKRTRGAVLIAVGLVAAGCAPSKVGVLAQLPDPVFNTPVARQSQAPAPPPVTRKATRPSKLSPWEPRGGTSGRWECIVIHHSGGQKGGAKAFHEFHTRVRHWDELGYHFVIGNGSDTPDGHVEVGPRWRKQKHGAHCKVPGNYYNDHGIGICLVGNFEHSRPTPAQMASLEELARYLMTACQIPPEQVNTHRGITGRTACPGRKFRLAELKRRLSIPTAGSGYR
jgi:hypothetical protein